MRTLWCWLRGGHRWDRAYRDEAMTHFRKMCGDCGRLGAIWNPGITIRGAVVKKEVTKG